MSVNFQELAYSATPMGLLTLRRRKDITLGIDIYEIKLDEEFLMSSLFTVAEVALANLGLAELSEPELDVVAGGLGLGYTASEPRVAGPHPAGRASHQAHNNTPLAFPGAFSFTQTRRFWPLSRLEQCRVTF